MKYIMVFIIIGGFHPVFTQETAIINFDGENKIYIGISPDKELHYTTNLEKGQTLYSLSKEYYSSVDDIVTVNDVDDASDLSIGMPIRIPFDPSVIIKDAALNQKYEKSARALIYKVKKKDNLFRLSKYYFDQPIENMMKRNNLNSFDISPGQELIVGWFILSENQQVNEDIVENMREKEEVSKLMKDTIGIYIKNELFNPDIEEQKVKRTLARQKTVAYCNKNSSNREDMFALHKSAQVNSIIEIYNPLLNRTAFATVIGPIPEESYKNDIGLIISPKVAKALGALDQRFMVEVKYYHN